MDDREVTELAPSGQVTLEMKVWIKRFYPELYPRHGKWSDEVMKAKVELELSASSPGR